MITAATNFSHLIVYDKAPEHSLVRTGIYGWSRHPSYVAFFYWAIGTQIFIGNPIALVAFSYILYRFFSHRIKGKPELNASNREPQLRFCSRGMVPRQILRQRLREVSEGSPCTHSVHQVETSVELDHLSKST